MPNYRAYDDRYAFLFNSYYNAEGDRHARPKRGMLSRPSLDDIRDWRASVDEALESAFAGLSPDAALVTNPNALLRDGDAVQVETAPPPAAKKP